jgi:hypothetical protein
MAPTTAPAAPARPRRPAQTRVRAGVRAADRSTGRPGYCPASYPWPPAETEREVGRVHGIASEQIRWQKDCHSRVAHPLRRASKQQRQNAWTDHPETTRVSSPTTSSGRRARRSEAAPASIDAMPQGDTATQLGCRRQPGPYAGHVRCPAETGLCRPWWPSTGALRTTTPPASPAADLSSG